MEIEFIKVKSSPLAQTHGWYKIAAWKLIGGHKRFWLYQKNRWYKIEVIRVVKLSDFVKYLGDTY